MASRDECFGGGVWLLIGLRGWKRLKTTSCGRGWLKVFCKKSAAHVGSERKSHGWSVLCLSTILYRDNRVLLNTAGVRSFVFGFRANMLGWGCFGGDIGVERDGASILATHFDPCELPAGVADLL
jgi:hypothetical protein